MEIIEIGAVRLPSAAAAPVEEFQSFVRPVVERQLSPFCTSLTSIRQHDVDGADPFAVVFPRFVDWIGPEPFVLGSWAAYDLNQFRQDCARHDLPLPTTFEDHVNVKQTFARHFGIKPCGMAEALTKSGVELTGTHHRAIDDVRNIARLAQFVLPAWERSRLKEATCSPLPQGERRAAISGGRR
ncbi:MAG: 3'-5' exonuclease [Pirellulales bacterium]